MSIRSGNSGRTAYCIVLVSVLLTNAAAARPADEPTIQSSSPDEIVVIGTTPLPGATIDADKVPSNVQTVRASDLARDGTANLRGALNSQLGSININDTLADPFQPDILYRGFEASPVLGTPQGLAVYQSGVRINEAFGDAVNWDLLPDIAISRIDFVSANPVFGLNALGGAASITMKDGFNYQGGEVAVSGGSFNQRSGSAELGIHDAALGFYAAGRILNQDGWRFFAHDSIRQLYTSLSARSDAGSVNLSYTHDANGLFGPGAAPVQSLAIDPRSVFTGPQANFNRLDFITLNGSYKVKNDLSLQSVLYFRNYRQSVSNGDGSNFTACTSAQSAGLLCQDDGQTPLVNPAGQPLPDITNGGARVLGQNDFENIHAVGLGGSFQLHDTQSIAGHSNQFTAGLSIDSAHVDFMSGTQLGVIDSNLIVQPSGLLVDTQEDAGFDATPVILKATNGYYGVFATDTLDLTRAFAVTVSGRYNVAQIDLFDRRGTNLDGTNRYTHFNPALGGTYKLSPTPTSSVFAADWWPRSAPEP